MRRHIINSDRNLILNLRNGILTADLVTQKDVFRQLARESGISLLNGDNIPLAAYDLLLNAASAHEFSITVIDHDEDQSA